MAQVSKQTKDERKKRQKESLLVSPDKQQEFNVFRDVESEWQKMAESNEMLHNSLASSYYSRQEIFKLYTRFKAMC